MRKPKEYAYYRGDEFIMIGTIQEIAEAAKYKVKTVEDWHYVHAIADDILRGLNEEAQE